MGALLDAIDRIVAIEAGLSITAPAAQSVKAAYDFAPPASMALPDLPAFFNSWSHVETQMQGRGRILRYRVQMQCVCNRAVVEDRRSARIATAFWEAALAAFSIDVTLNGTVTRALLRGGEPTLALITRGNEAYVGFNAFLDIEVNDAFTWA